MKAIKKSWALAGVAAVTLLTGCATHHHADWDRYDYRHYHHHHWGDRDYRHDSMGRPPGYYQGGDVDVYIGPDAPRVPRKW